MANKAQVKLNFYNGYGDNFRKLRTDNNMTLQELSSVIHYSDKTISFIETERRPPTIEQLNKYSDYFGVSLDYLTGRTKAAKANIQMICEYTGLSEDNLEKLNILTDLNKNAVNAIDRLLTVMLKNKYLIEDLTIMLNEYSDSFAKQKTIRKKYKPELDEELQLVKEIHKAKEELRKRPSKPNDDKYPLKPLCEKLDNVSKSNQDIKKELRTVSDSVDYQKWRIQNWFEKAIKRYIHTLNDEIESLD